MAGAKRQWLANVSLYTLAGAASSLGVGYALGLAGSWLFPSGATTAGLAAVAAVAALAATRELGWLKVPVPQHRRQTNGAWAQAFGLRRAALLWGIDLGTTVSTRFTFAGTWALILLPLALADPLLGATAFLACWLGRAAPVWILPPLIDRNASALGVLDSIGSQHRTFSYSHVVGLALLITSLAWSAVEYQFPL